MANGNWFQTFTGKKFYPFNPDPKLICIEDIAHALSLLCRFNGHTKGFYSVALHSIYVTQVFSGLVKSTELENNDQAHLCALLHDATEAYCGDMVRPIKRGLPEYQQLEGRLWTAIELRFNFVDTWMEVAEIVHKADEIMLATERRDILPEGPAKDRDQWFIDEKGVVPDVKRIAPRPPGVSEQWFLDVYNSLIPREEREKAL